MNINAIHLASPRPTRLRAALTAVALLGLSACMRAPLQLQDSTSHLEGPRSFEAIGPAEGKACQFNLFYLIPIGGNQLWKAKERAIGDADGLVDVSVDTSLGFPIIGLVACTEVRGTRYRLVKQPASFEEPPVLPEAPPPEELVPEVEGPVDDEEGVEAEEGSEAETEDGADEGAEPEAQPADGAVE